MAFNIQPLACGLPSSLGPVDAVQYEKSGPGFSYSIDTNSKFWAHPSWGAPITGPGPQTDVLSVAWDSSAHEMA